MNKPNVTTENEGAFERGVAVGVILSFAAFIWMELALNVLLGG